MKMENPIEGFNIDDPFALPRNPNISPKRKRAPRRNYQKEFEALRTEVAANIELLEELVKPREAGAETLQSYMEGQLEALKRIQERMKR